MLASGDIVVSDPGNSAYVLFSPNGVHRRNVRFEPALPPQRMPVAVSASGRAAYFITDELGVEHVEVRQLPFTWK